MKGWKLKALEKIMPAWQRRDVYKRQVQFRTFVQERKYVRGMKVQGLAQSQHGAEVLIGDGQVMPGDDTVLQVFEMCIRDSSTAAWTSARG